MVSVCLCVLLFFKYLIFYHSTERHNATRPGCGDTRRGWFRNSRMAHVRFRRGLSCSNSCQCFCFCHFFHPLTAGMVSIPPTPPPPSRLPQPLAALHPAVEGGGGERYAAMPVAPRGARSPAHPSSSDGSRIEEDGGTLTRRAAGRLESAANAGADHVGSPPYLTLKGSRSDVLQAAKSLAEALPRKVQRRNTTCRNTAQGPILFTDEVRARVTL